MQWSPHAQQPAPSSAASRESAGIGSSKLAENMFEARHGGPWKDLCTHQSPMAALSGLPHDVLTLIGKNLGATSLSTLCAVSRGCRQAFASNELWQPFCTRRGWHHSVHAIACYRSRFVVCMDTRRDVRATFHALRLFIGSDTWFLQGGLGAGQILHLERGYGWQLPVDLREFFVLCNGEVPRPTGEGLIYGLRMLPLEQALEERKRAGGGHLPVTEAQAARQYQVGDDGKVVYVCGFTERVVSDTWLAFLRSLMEPPSH